MKFSLAEIIEQDKPDLAVTVTQALLDEAESLGRSSWRGKAIKTRPSIRYILPWPYRIYY